MAIVQVIIHLTQNITITIPSSPLLADTVFLSLSGAVLLIWKSSFFKKQTARTSKQAKTAYDYNCIRRPASSFIPC